MKRLIYLFLILLLAMPAWGADYTTSKKIDELTDVSGAITKSTLIPVQDMNDLDKIGSASVEDIVNKGLEAPGPIGGTTPAAGEFTTLKNTGKVHHVLSAGNPMLIGGDDIATLAGVTISNANPSVLTKDATIDDGLAVGDAVVVNSGTNATVGTYIVASIVANTSVTLDRQAATGACTDASVTYVNDAIVVEVASGSGKPRIVLPLHNDAVTPTLAFGDGDTGIYESIDDTLSFSLAGTVNFRMVGGRFATVASAGASLHNTGATATTPVFRFENEWDTGIGLAAADQLSLIAGGVEGVRISEDTTIQVNSFGPVIKKYTITTDNTNGVGTHTIAELLGGLIRRGTGDELTGNVIDVTDTAANIVAGITGCAVGSGFEFSISNEDSINTIQLDGGAGVTMAPNDPSTAIPANSTGRFLLVVTNATAESEAVTVHALGFTTH